MVVLDAVPKRTEETIKVIQVGAKLEARQRVLFSQHDSHRTRLGYRLNAITFVPELFRLGMGATRLLFSMLKA